MGKVFGYPEFSDDGEMILTTYDNDYKAMMMDIRVYRMKAGEKRTFCREGEEIAVLLLSGKVVYGWDGNSAEASRKDVFTEGPWALHVCGGHEITVTAEADTEILVQCTKKEGVPKPSLQTRGRSVGLLQRWQIRQRGKTPCQYYFRS